MRSVTRAFLVTLLVGGCSVTVKPLRTPFNGAHIDPATNTPIVRLDQVSPELPIASCAEQPPAPVLDTTAKFVLQNGHERPIMRLGISADGRTLVSAGFDGTVRVWDVRSGILLRKFGTAGVFVNGLSLSANGKRLAYYAPDGTPEGLAIRIVDLDDGSPPRTVTPQYGSFELSSDGKKLAIAVDKLMVFDADSGALLHDVPLGMKSPMALDVAFDDADARIAVTAPGEAVIVDAAKGTIVQRLSTNYSSPADVPSNIAFVKDGVVVRSAVGVVTRYSTTKATAPVTLPEKYKDFAVAGNRLWVTDMMKEHVSAFALPNLTRIDLPAPYPAKAQLIAASTDESTVVFAHGRNDSGSLIDARDAETMRPVRTIEGRVTGIDAIAVNPAADELVTGSFIGELGRWNLRDGSRAVPLPDEESDRGRMVDIDYVHHGEFFASTNGSYVARVRDTKTGRTLRLWTPQSGHDLTFTGFIPKTTDLVTVAMRIERKVSATKKTPSGIPVVDETFDTVVSRWDLAGPRPPFPRYPFGTIAPPAGKPIGHASHEASRVAMSPKGDLLALGGSSEVALMRVNGGDIAWVTRLQTIILGGTKQPDGALDHQARWYTFSPDGKTLLLSTRRLETNAKGVQAYVPTLLMFDTSNGRVTSTHRLDTHGPIAWRSGKILVGGPRPMLLDASKWSLGRRTERASRRRQRLTWLPSRGLLHLTTRSPPSHCIRHGTSSSSAATAAPHRSWTNAEASPRRSCPHRTASGSLRLPMARIGRASMGRGRLRGVLLRRWKVFPSSVLRLGSTNPMWLLDASWARLLPRRFPCRARHDSTSTRRSAASCARPTGLSASRRRQRAHHVSIAFERSWMEGPWRSSSCVRARARWR